jgi:hypothetical protein
MAKPKASRTIRFEGDSVLISSGLLLRAMSESGRFESLGDSAALLVGLSGGGI